MARSATRQAVPPTPPEAGPEADRLGAWPHPRQTEAVIGHDSARAQLSERLESGRIAQGWIVAGPPGIGKATLVYDFAAEALARGVETVEQARRLIAVQSHPRLLVMRRTFNQQTKKLRTRIAVDDVRRLKAFLGTTAGEGWRVVIVDSADDLNVNSANALLKSLEEPPSRTLFFLIASSAGRLLPTIASRCERLKLEPLGPGETRRVVETVSAASGVALPEPDRFSQVLEGARGRPRRALELMSHAGDEVSSTIRRIFAGLPNLDDNDVFRLIDAVNAPKSDVDYDLVFDLVEDALTEAIRRAAQEDRQTGVFAVHGLARWMEVWDTGRQLRADAEALNLDRAITLLRFFTQIEKSAHTQRALSA